METKLNEFKFSTLRQFGSENVSFTATIHSSKECLSDEEIKAQVNAIDILIKETFSSIQNREIREKELLIEGSEKRTATVKKLDEALKEEMKAKNDANATMDKAVKLNNKLAKK